MLHLEEKVNLISPPTKDVYRVIRIFNEDEYIQTQEGSFLYAKKGNVTIKNERTGDTLITCADFVKKVDSLIFA
ncbi:hypothetical protein [Persicobacter psychrovividus]|uniref:Uncharacterized protein n=1 Tax=Persicobacter psychrovividus TaxID=387638 RepID=A0ABN6LD75_9BACT|nr:hypothetical protein PEPS_34200 [Persicobacter psychrovividus]